jgi:hypothetical protein
MSSDMGQAIGEKYCDRYNLIVLENTENEIKIVVSKEYFKISVILLLDYLYQLLSSPNPIGHGRDPSPSLRRSTVNQFRAAYSRKLQSFAALSITLLLGSSS